MSAFTVNVQSSVTTDALYRNMAINIDRMMLEGGWVKTSDPAQYNVNTMVRPAVGAYSAGYLLYRSNDGDGTKGEIYAKFTIGMANLGGWMVGCQVGFGTDGAGNLTGNTGFYGYSGGNGIDGLFRNWYFSAGTGWFNFCTEAGYFAHTGYISVERPLNTDLSERDEIFLILGDNNNNSTSQVTVPRVGKPYPVLLATGNATTNYGDFAKACVNPLVGSAVQIKRIGVSRIFSYRGHLGSMSINCLGATHITVGAAGTTHPFSSYGTEHRYMLTATSTEHPRFHNNPVQQILMRYE